MGLTIELGIAKINKYASRESGDTAEVVERPGGGFSVVLVDGQGSGAAAKALSMLLTAKAVSLLKEGVRDGAVARAVHDTLLAYRRGKVSASLDILSADLMHRNLVLTRNGTTPVIVQSKTDVFTVPANEGPIGIYPFTRPSVMQFPLEQGLQIWLMTDGIVTAGRKWGAPPLELPNVATKCSVQADDIQSQARLLLDRAIEADRGRPSDDMCVVTMRTVASVQEIGMRTLRMTFPLT
jgi:serine phosphatase RsbU (regulator of sigma subunit)